MLLQDIQREKSDAKQFGAKQKLLQAVISSLRGPMQAYLKVTFGLFAGLAGAVVSTAFSAAGNYIGFNAQRRAAVNAYRDELALLVGKDRDTITEDDMRQFVAKNPQNPIATDLALINYNQAAIQKKSLTKNLLISAAVLPFAALFPVFATTIAGFAVITAIGTALDLVTEDMLERWQVAQRPLGSAFARQIHNELSRSKVLPTRLMEYVVQTNPQIADVIRKNTGEEFNSISLEKKETVMQKLDMLALLQKIADDLNHGKIRPSELPFLLAGLDSPSTPIRNYIGKSTAPNPAPDHLIAPASVAPVIQPETIVHTPHLESTISRQPAQALAM